MEVRPPSYRTISFSPPSMPPSSCVHSNIMFVLQIGSVSQTDSCNVALDQANTLDRAVLLQYSVNNGVSWHVIAQHQPKDFIKAQRVSYNIQQIGRAHV